MKDDIIDTVGLAPMVDKIADLVRKREAGTIVAPLPPEALPPGLTLASPHLIVQTDGHGRIEISPVTDHIDKLRGKPARRKGTATATTLDSFFDLVNRNGDDNSVIFLDANWRAPKVTAVLNYNLAAVGAGAAGAAAPEEAGDDRLARFGDHRVAYAFPLSESWKAWVAQNTKWMKAAEFSAWLESHIAEIAVADTEPGSAEAMLARQFQTSFALPIDLVNLAKDLEIVVDAKIKTRNRLQSGETTIVFETEHKDLKGQPVTIPGLFVLSLPIFFRGLPQRIVARLRYRPAGEDGVLWSYELHRPDEAVDERVRADAEEIKHRTGRLLIDGAPEA